MDKSILLASVLGMTAFYVTGCGQSSNPYAAVDKLYKPSPDTDVSSSPQYNFSSFTGTVWRTKVNVAVADQKHYTNEYELNLLVPKHFDRTHPEYTSGVETRIIAVLPVGTRLRIERLMKDNGNWGGVRVKAKVEAGPDTQKIVYLDPMLLEKNRFVWPGWSSSTNWGVDPDMLEK